MSLSLSLHARLEQFRLEVALEAPAGITALFGPSGAGKTATLRCVAGLTRPLAGRVILHGRALFDSARNIDLPPRERRVGYVFQQYALFPHLSVARNVGFGLAGWSRESREARIAELLTLVGLGGYGARSTRGLSGGEQQRVALARALAPGPDMVLLDEPFAALDGRVRRRLREELIRIQRATGVPMLLVTHDLAEVRALAGWMVLLENGRTLAQGETERLLRQPPHAAAARVLEESR